MQGSSAPRCEMPVRTYRGMASFLFRLVTAPLALPFLLLRLRRIAPDLAICAMPGPLDVLMAVALRLLGTRLVVVVHDADAHPGDGFPGQMLLQRALCWFANGLAVLCGHVGTRLRQQGLAGTGRRALIRFKHPPFGFRFAGVGAGRRAAPAAVFRPFAAIQRAGPAGRGFGRFAGGCRDCGAGGGQRAESAALDALRACRGVTVENRWVPESEIGALLAWSEAVILPYREASQSGVAAAALAAGRPVIATNVGGLAEQLSAASQAVLCDPDPGSLMQGIRRWLESPSEIPMPTDATTAWRHAGSDLLAAIGAALPHTRPVRVLRPGVIRLPGRSVPMIHR